MALFLPKSPTALDAGAHNGGDTVQMSLLWPGATIHAFEPVPAVYRQLEANTKSLANVRRYPCALAGGAGTVTMHVSSGGTDASSSLLAPKEHLAVNPHVVFEDVITVATTTLDLWAAENGRHRGGPVSGASASFSSTKRSTNAISGSSMTMSFGPKPRAARPVTRC